MYASLKEKIVARLRADATLAPLLTSTDAVYYQRPPQARALPCLTYGIADEPLPSTSSRQRARLELTITLWATSGAANDAILAALHAALHNAHHDGALDTIDWQVRSCRRLGGAVGEGGRDEEGAEIERRITRWGLEIVEKPA